MIATVPVDGVVLTQGTIIIIGMILTPFTATIIALYKLLLGRLKRAEDQVDTLLPVTNAVVESLKTVREELVLSNGRLKDLQDYLNRQVNPR